jgi:hypothetical protein
VAGVPLVWDAGRVLVSGVVLAHQGGWDEALMVIAPVALFAGLLWVASRRAAPIAPSEHPRTSADRARSDRGVLRPAEHRVDR